MIIFHEGLPGSGKSYEAAINQIIPALKKGRSVYAYIEGLNRVKFSQVTDIPLEEITKLLHPLTKEQVADVQNHIPNDCLLILDELQDFFPTSKTSLDAGITELVTQHRHRGIDIVCMGQDNRDCHMLWKRRIDTLIRFVKRDAIGMPNAYTWTTYKQQAGKFVQLRSGKGTYDKQYFGLYASHSEGVSSIDAHKDDRTNILKSSAFTLWIPAFVVVLIVAIYYVWGFFHSSALPKQADQTKPTVSQAVPKREPVQPPIQQEQKPDDEIKTIPMEKDYLDEYLSQYRARLVGLIESKEKNRMVAQIEFVDEGNKTIERLDIPAIVAFGYIVERKPYGLLLVKGKNRYPVTPFPIDRGENVTHYNHENNGVVQTGKPQQQQYKRDYFDGRHLAGLDDRPLNSSESFHFDNASAYRSRY